MVKPDSETASSGLDPAAVFSFPLDDFQLEAVAALNQGHSVVVSAPTGSGKTLVGEYAIHRVLAHGQKVFYPRLSRRCPTRNCGFPRTVR